MILQHNLIGVRFLIQGRLIIIALEAQADRMNRGNKEAAMTDKQATIHVRRAGERGHADHGWLNSYHTFSFAGYLDPNYMGFRTLRVINDDTVAPGRGFGKHPHRDMEIISYVVAGALAHEDSMGHESVIGQRQVQKITAGSGIAHSEFNHSNTDPVHFYQIWIEPREHGLEPSYGEMDLNNRVTNNGLILIASPDERDHSVLIHQDALMYEGQYQEGKEVTYQTHPDRGVWIQLVHGSLDVEGYELNRGDAISIENTDTVNIISKSTSTFLLFDLR